MLSAHTDRPVAAAAPPGRRPGLPGYAELHCRSNFSFLAGASHPGELVQRAWQLGYTALALTDECSLAGVVRAHLEIEGERARLRSGGEAAASPHPLPRLIVGAQMRLSSGARLVVLAQSRRGYGNLSHWITVARRRAPIAGGDSGSR